MIIKDKPFHIPDSQAVACRFYFPPFVLGSELNLCRSGLVRRWPGFLALEAYQVRLSRLLVLRRLGLVHDWRLCDDGLVNSGGVW